MKIGLIYPQNEFGNDPAAIKDFAQNAEALGYSHIIAYDHVLGAKPPDPDNWPGPYTFEHPFQSPFLLYAFMAAVTTKIEFATGILILPQRQTALVAKQAATLDVLSGGRLRLGIGTGWNQVEYVALGQDFHTRGRLQEEQVELLRKLWTEPVVNFQGRWHDIPDAGINPMPIQQPIPIWFGGHHDNVLRRVAKLGDGWMPNYRSAADAKPALDKLDAYLSAAGRARADIGLEARLSYAKGDPETWTRTIEEWQALGATHLTLNTMYLGFDTPAAHMQAARSFAEAVGVSAE